MAQITGIGLENFRVFKEYTEFDFAPITIFTGTNSSGKSSVFKALMLLQDSWENNKLKYLDFTGERHHLGNFKNSISNNTDDKNEISLSLKFSFEDIKAKNTEAGISQITYRENFFLNHIKLDLKFIDEFWGLNNLSLISPELQNDKHQNIINSLFPTEEREDYINFFSFVNIEGLLNHYNQSSVFENIQEYERLGNEKFLLKGALVEKKRKRQNKIRNSFEEGKNDSSEALDSEKIKSLEDLIKQGKFITPYIDFLENVIPFEKYILNFFKNITSKEVKIFKSSFEERLEVFGKERRDLFTSKFKSVIINQLSFEGIFSVNHTDIWDTWNVSAFLNYWGFPDEYKKILKQKLLDYNKGSLLEFEELLQVLSDYKLSDVIDESFISITDGFFREYIKSISKSINSLQDIHYIPTIRANTQRIYTYKSQGTDMNELLLKTHHVTEFVNKWCEKFGIADKVEIRDIKGVAKEVVLKKNGKEMDLADLGYGVTQLLPIMLKIINSFDLTLIRLDDIMSLEKETLIKNIHKINHPNGPILMLEEPETNLHPKLQSMLADFLVDAAKTFEVTLLVETHSEYLIRKLQYLTAKKEIKPEDTAIYYLYPPNEVPEGAKQVERIKIKENGRLSGNFGTGFFDESANLMMATLTGKNLN